MKLSEYFIRGVTANTTDCKHYNMSAGPDLAGTRHTSQPPGAEKRRQWQLGALHTVTTRTTQLGTVTGTEMRPDEDLRNIRQVSHQQNFTVSR